MLDLSSFKKALVSLEEALIQRGKEPANTFVRDACIQRFEYTYELSHKMLKRYLEEVSASPTEVDEMSFPDLIRTGYERGLLSQEWSEWKIYRKSRGTTSHTYDESKAEEVLALVPEFFAEAKFLYGQLEKAST